MQAIWTIITLALPRNDFTGVRPQFLYQTMKRHYPFEHIFFYEFHKLQSNIFYSALFSSVYQDFTHQMVLEENSSPIRTNILN